MSAVQVDKSHYGFGAYGFEGRFVSYYHQLKEVLSRKPESVLEVGVGDKVFGDFLKNNTKVAYHSVDIAEDLQPDTIAEITKLPFADDTFDIVCAFEVLEHIPFEQFDAAVAEMARLAKKNIIISVPHFGPMLSFSLKAPFLPHMRIAFKIPFPKTQVFNGQHYWEIGKKGYPVSSIRKRLAMQGTVVADFVPWGSEYHHFFVIDVA